LATRAAFRFGLHRELTSKPRLTPVRLVFVCSGNICRSAYARVSAEREIPHVPVSSYGIAADTTMPAWEPITAEAKRRGLDLSAHRSARLTASTLREGDLVLVFEARHAEHVRKLSSGLRSLEIRLLGYFSSPVHLHVEDPYGLPYFVPRCLDIIDRSVSGLREAISALSEMHVDSK
jgi:protein-tyrosine phosphatase